MSGTLTAKADYDLLMNVAKLKQNAAKLGPEEVAKQGREAAKAARNIAIVYCFEFDLIRNAELEEYRGLMIHRYLAKDAIASAIDARKLARDYKLGNIAEAAAILAEKIAVCNELLENKHIFKDHTFHESGEILEGLVSGKSGTEFLGPIEYIDDKFLRMSKEQKFDYIDAEHLFLALENGNDAFKDEFDSVVKKYADGNDTDKRELDILNYLLLRLHDLPDGKRAKSYLLLTEKYGALCKKLISP